MSSTATLRHLSYTDQLELLKSRALIIGDEERAIEQLERIGYYRLQSYLTPFRETDRIALHNGKFTTEVLDGFQPGATFEQAIDLYVFDKQFRLLMADAIEGIEIALRVDLSHALGRRDPFAHLRPECLDPQTQQRLDRYTEWRDRAEKMESRSSLDWIEAARSQGPLPVWKAVETWDFGCLIALLDLTHRVDRAEIASKYRIPNAKTHMSWLRTFGYVRNITAHHTRLWNHPLVIQPMALKQGTVPMLDHLGTFVSTRTRAYAAAAIIQYILRTIAPESAWGTRLKALWGTFPKATQLRPVQAGFMPNWETWPLWK